MKELITHAIQNTRRFSPSFLPIVLIFFSLSKTNGQGPGNHVTWKIATFYNAANSDTINRSCEFVVFDSGSILWKQNEGTKIYEFVVTTATGTWSNFDEDGSITYHVTRAGLNGTLRFQRDEGVVRIYMTFMQNGTNIMPYTFNVVQIQQ